MKWIPATDWTRRFFSALILAALVAVPMSAVNPKTAPVRADGAPPFSGVTRPFIYLKEPRTVRLDPLEDARGAPVALDRYRGKVLLVNFWATWCGPCIHEMPTLDRLQGALGGEYFDVLPISLDRKGLEKVTPFWREQGYKHLPILLDSRWKSARNLGVSSLPATFLLDHNHRIIGYLIGAAKWDSPQAKAFLRFYIARAGK
ncbi:MAG: TlpA disulfide reductase family protein [Rhodospirillaceae bacterium]|nr:TlpA disulfide reductase family protein [Rhodospirillaceae bacterium]